MNISLNELSPVIEICVAMITGLTVLYFRLSSRIDKAEQKLDQKVEHKFEALRAEMERKFDKVDQKLDNIMNMLFTQNQISRAGHFHKKNKDVG